MSRLRAFLTKNRLNLYLALASVLVSILLAEIGYRVYLSRMVPESKYDHLSFDVVNKSYWEYDERLGFRYKPNVSADSVTIMNSLPYKTSSVVFDHRGNSGLEVDDTNADLKVFVVGDSFTMIPHDGITWPHILQKVLSEKTGRKVAVLNYSREGYGILQMMDQASLLVDEKPDAILLAFITPDLVRERSWRMELATPSGVDVFTSTTPVLQLDKPKTFVRSTLVNPLATRKWAEEMIVKKDPNDPALRLILGSYLRARESHYITHYNPLSLGTLYLWERIVNRRLHGTGSQNPIIMYNNYAVDQRFMEAVRKVKRSNIPLYLVHLPYYPELVIGDYQLSQQGDMLRKSLRFITEAPLLEVRPPVPMGALADVMIIWPGNPHPSMQGLNLYANQVGEALLSDPALGFTRLLSGRGRQ